MPLLHRRIRELVLANRYLIGEHAAERLAERGVLEWQLVEGLEQGQLIVEHPQAQPNPAIEVRQMLIDGTPVKAVWSCIESIETAKLVTVHYLD
jgi:hypothetical protein